jgi:hypothetical protein
MKRSFGFVFIIGKNIDDLFQVVQLTSAIWYGTMDPLAHSLFTPH